MKLATHNGTFHTDDVFAIALLSELYPDAQVIRSRNDAVLDTADIVVDVGRVYDPHKKRFDHHQKQAGTRQNGIVYSGFGLVWKEYGLTFCDNNKEVWQRIDNKLVQHIDARDNGQKTYQTDTTRAEPFIIDDIISYLNVSSFDDSESGTHDQRFMDAVSWARSLLVRIKKKELDMVAAEEQFMELYKKSTDKRCIMLDKYLPFNALLPKYPELLYAIYPDEVNKNWMVEAVRKDPHEFGSRRPFPELWRAQEATDLIRVTQVNDAVFCHSTGFICAAKSHAGAYALMQLALKP